MGENSLQLSRHATCSMRLQTHMIGLGSQAHLIVCFVDSTCTRIVKACVQSCPIHFNILCWPFEARQRRLVNGSMGSYRAARVAGGVALGFIVMAILSGCRARKSSCYSPVRGSHGNDRGVEVPETTSEIEFQEPQQK